MIKLDDFPSYCQNCFEISPEAIILDVTCMSDTEPRLITTITCSTMDRCRKMLEHLQRKVGD